MVFLACVLCVRFIILFPNTLLGLDWRDSMPFPPYGTVFGFVSELCKRIANPLLHSYTENGHTKTFPRENHAHANEGGTMTNSYSLDDLDNVQRRLDYLDDRQEGLLFVIGKMHAMLATGVMNLSDPAQNAWLQGVQDDLRDTQAERDSIHFNLGYPMSSMPSPSKHMAPDVDVRVNSLRVRGWDDVRIREDIQRLARAR